MENKSKKGRFDKEREIIRNINQRVGALIELVNTCRPKKTLLYSFIIELAKCKELYEKIFPQTKRGGHIFKLYKLNSRKKIGDNSITTLGGFTNDPRIEFPIGEVLNITVKYLDIKNQHVPGATIQLIGDFSGVLSENSSFNQYSYILNSTQLDIGVSLTTLIASKINFQLQIDNLRIDVHRIKTNISGNSIIEILAGEIIHIEVELTDLDFGGPILDATVMYTWQFGQGNLTDIDSDGIYEINLTSYSVETYILEITADKGVNYDFQSFQITIIISNPFSVFILSSSADIPDSDGNFYLLWISSGHANNYSIYVSNSNITQINSSVILLGVHTNNSPYLISGLSDGTYYFVVVAINEYGNFSSNCIQVIVSLKVEEALIPGYNLFILICIIPIFSVIVIQKQLRNKIREKKH